MWRQRKDLVATIEKQQKALADLRKSLEERIRLPDLHRRLSALEDGLHANVEQYEQFATHVDRLIAGCNALLTALRKSLQTAADKKLIAEVETQLTAYRATPSKQTGRGVALAVTSLRSHLRERIADKTWEN